MRRRSRRGLGCGLVFGGVSARASSSSMAMSLNSAESKTSPQFWHSTNSASSSRATIFDDGMFAFGGHGWGGNRECYGFCPSLGTLSTAIL